MVREVWPWPVVGGARQSFRGAELLMAHHQNVRGRGGDDGRFVQPTVSHRVPTERVAGTQLRASRPTMCLQQPAGDDQNLVTQASFARQLSAHGHALLIDEGEQLLELAGGAPRQLPRGAQDAQALPVAHETSLAESGKEPSPTPSEKASRMPGATRRSSRIDAWLSPWTSTANAVMPWLIARSARAATSRVPMPCLCHASATTIARSASDLPLLRAYCATPTISPPSTAAIAARSRWSTRTSAAANCSGPAMGLKKRR